MAQISGELDANSADKSLPNTEQTETQLEVEKTEISLEVASEETQLEVEKTETSLEVASEETQLEVERTETSLEVASEETQLEVENTETSLEVEAEEARLESDIVEPLLESKDIEPALTAQRSTNLTLLQKAQQFSLRIPLTWCCSLLVGVVALGLNIYQLGVPGITSTEARSIELAQQALSRVGHVVFGGGINVAPNMALYYYLLHGWLRFTGLLGWNPTEVVVRFPSAIFGALSSIVVFLIGRRFLGLIAGLLAAGLYLLNSVQLTSAQSVSSESLQLLLICLSLFALLTVLNKDSHQKRWWACFIAATLLSIYVNSLSLIFLLAQMLSFAGLLFIPGNWRTRAWAHWRGFVISLILIGACTTPLVIPNYHLLFGQADLLPTLENNTLVLIVLFVFLLFGLVVSLLASLPQGEGVLKRVSLLKSDDEQHLLRLKQVWPVGFVLVSWLVVQVVAYYVISAGQTPIFSGHYLVTIVPALCLLAALGVIVLRWKIVQVVLVSLLLLVSLGNVLLSFNSAQVEDWNSTSHWLMQQYRAGDGIICYDNANDAGCQLSVQYYLDAYSSNAQFTDDSPGAFSWANYGPADPQAGYGAAVDPQAIATYAQTHPRLFFIAGRLPNAASAAKLKSAQQWMDAHFRLIGQIVTRTVTIRLYLTGSAAYLP